MPMDVLGTGGNRWEPVGTFLFPLGSSGVFSPDYLRCDPVQLQRQVPGKVPVQRLGEVLQGSGADT